MELGTTGAASSGNKNELNNYLRKLCSGVTLQSNKDGFFNAFVRNVQDNRPLGFQDEFSKLKGDLERIKKTWHLPDVQALKVDKCFIGKNYDVSEERRKKGNVAFTERQDRNALKFYTQAVLRAPSASSAEDCLSLALANRSAVLFHLKEYSQCVADVTLALEANLPAKLRYKVLDRRANCYVQLDSIGEAILDYQSALESMSHSPLDNNRKQEFSKGLQEKIDQLRTNTKPATNGQQHKSATIDDPLYEGQSKILLQASAAIRVEVSHDAGRHIVANKDLPAGVTIVRENPFSSVLLPEKVGLHCTHCFARVLAPISCDTCCLVTFCGSGCKAAAMSTYHQWECQFSNLLTASGMSLNSFLALRIITERPFSYFAEARNRLQINPRALSASNPHRCDDYANIYNLAALEDMRTQEEFFHRSLMAIFLLKVLIASGYVASPDESELSEDAAYIGSLLLRHLQVIQFNAHEVSGICYQGEKSYKKCKSVFLGLAIYPTVSFFNHSCFPAIGRYFNGKEMTVVSLRPILKGQPIEENYGPIFTKLEQKERSKKLLSRYWFNCSCEACVGNWPTYAILESCPSTIKCPNCSQRLITSKKKASGKGTIEYCSKCGFAVSHQALKAKVRKTKSVYEYAMNAMEKGDQSEAVKLFLKYINDTFAYVILPHQEIHLALDALRLLIAAKGTNYLSYEESK